MAPIRPAAVCIPMAVDLQQERERDSDGSKELLYYIAADVVGIIIVVLWEGLTTPT